MCSISSHLKHEALLLRNNDVMMYLIFSTHMYMYFQISFRVEPILMNNANEISKRSIYVQKVSTSEYFPERFYMYAIFKYGINNQYSSSISVYFTLSINTVLQRKKDISRDKRHWNVKRSAEFISNISINSDTDHIPLLRKFRWRNFLLSRYKICTAIKL